MVNSLPVISLRQVRKEYRLYRSQLQHLLAIVGMHRLISIGSAKIPIKVALSGIDLDIYPGEKVGIIGQNGSGKTTLLKLITGFTQPTAGKLKIRGSVQAMMQTGFGFDQELTGLENITNSLIFNGLKTQQQQTAVQEIIDFVELGEFIHYPLKTYSLGMRSRLEFATATAIHPDIIAIDEVLGSGDGYFAHKCAERMRTLIQNCTLLLISHSMQQILQYCQRVLWLQEGQIVADGRAEAVIKAYETSMLKATEALATRPEQTSGNHDLDENRFKLESQRVKQRSQHLLGVSYPLDHPLQPAEILKVGFENTWAAHRVVETGARLSVRMQYRLPVSFSGTIQALMFAFSTEGKLIWAIDPQPGCLPRNKLGEQAGKNSELEITCPQLIAGVGEYYLTVGLQINEDAGRSTTCFNHAQLFLHILPGNWSDPPLLHYPGSWEYEADPGVRVPARINAWC